MGRRRMYSDKITGSGRFLMMPYECQALYFQLCMHSDDDGIVEAYPVMKLTGCKEDTLQILLAKDFIKVLNKNDLIAYVTDWNEHNLIRADRKIDSIYQDLLLQVLPEVKIVRAKKRADTKKKTGQITGGNSGRPLDAFSRPKLSKDKLSKDKYLQDFEKFYQLYPVKKGRKKALASWMKLKPNSQLTEEILAALETHKRSKQWTKDDGQFIPHPATWLNQQRWEDEVESVAPKNTLEVYK